MLRRREPAVNTKSPPGVRNSPKPKRRAVAWTVSGSLIMAGGGPWQSGLH